MELRTGELFSISKGMEKVFGNWSFMGAIGSIREPFCRPSWFEHDDIHRSSKCLVLSQKGVPSRRQYVRLSIGENRSQERRSSISCSQTFSIPDESFAKAGAEFEDSVDIAFLTEVLKLASEVK